METKPKVSTNPAHLSVPNVLKTYTPCSVIPEKEACFHLLRTCIMQRSFNTRAMLDRGKPVVFVFLPLRFVDRCRAPWGIRLDVTFWKT